MLAAGDFASNDEMRADLLTHITDCFQEGRSDWSQTMSQDGSGIKMGVWAGGRLEPRPIATMNGDFAKGSYPQAIWLDTNGERYCNEYFSDCTLAGKPQARIAHVDTFSIADSKLAENVLYCLPAPDAFEPTDANMAALNEKLTAAIGTGKEGYSPIVQGPPGAPGRAGPPGPAVGAGRRAAAAVSDATGTGDIVTQFNQLLANLRSVGILAEQ